MQCQDATEGRRGGKPLVSDFPLNPSLEGSRLTGVGKEVSLPTHSLSNSVTDSGIRNCNKLFWLKDEVLEAKKLWELGKSMGVNNSGCDEALVRKLVELEQRDEAEVTKRLVAEHEGTNNGVL